MKESASAKAVADRHAAWKADCRPTRQALWDALAALDDASRLALFAHCASFGVNALFEQVNRSMGARRLRPWLAAPPRSGRSCWRARSDLDMAEAGWRPTVDNYLGRVTKPRILEAVREAKGEPSAQLIDHLKKSDMAKEAERLLDGSGWLPEPLRLAEVARRRRSRRVKRERCPNSSPTTRSRRARPTRSAAQLDRRRITSHRADGSDAALAALGGRRARRSLFYCED